MSREALSGVGMECTPDGTARGYLFDLSERLMLAGEAACFWGTCGAVAHGR